MSNAKVPASNSMKVLPNGVIVLTQTGYQTLDTVAQFQAEIDDLTSELHKQGKKVLILVDVSGVTGQDPNVLADARERLKADYDALALYGQSPVISMIINWLVTAVGNSERVRSFKDYNEALAWLLSHQY